LTVTIRVLIVDDDDRVRAALRSRLEQARDIDPVGEARSADEAVTRAKTLQPDVVLLDLLMPRKRGIEAIAGILTASPDTRILMVSSQGAVSSVRRALIAGAAGYIPKRSSDRQLLDAIRQIDAGNGYLDPALGAELVVPRASSALEPLSGRERDVLELLALGYTNQEIGKQLFISVRTVDTHRAHVMSKLALESRAELVLFALANGVIRAATSG
jgi:DNA-binding NarL/FixJ family response regulator